MPCNKQRPPMSAEKYLAWVSLGALFYATASVITVQQLAEHFGNEKPTQTAQATLHLDTPHPL